jgi:hypothetical protein
MGGCLRCRGQLCRMRLAWFPSPDKGVSYNIHRSMTSGFTPSAANKIGQTSATTYTDASFSIPGTYYYVVTAQDASGKISVPSNEAAVAITLDTTNPTVSVTSPAPGTTVSRTVTITASASDEVGVAGVQFLLDGTSLGPEVPGPASAYTSSWPTTTTANGPHTLSAIARR